MLIAAAVVKTMAVATPAAVATELIENLSVH
jgi:hypothetical protein